MGEAKYSQLAKKPLKRFFLLLRPDKRDILYIFVFSFFAGLIALTIPLGIQAIINLIAGGQFAVSWVVLILVVAVGTTFAGILRILQVSIVENLQRRLFVRSAFEFAYRIPRFRPEAIHGRYPPELVNRFFDTVQVQKGLSKILLDFSSAIVEVVFGLVLIGFYHPTFIIFSFLVVLLIGLLLALTWQRGLETSLKESTYKYDMAHWLEELARNASTFKQAGYSTLPLTQTDKLTVQYLDARKKHFFVLLQQLGGAVFFKVFVTGVLLGIGGFLVMTNQINIGQFVAAEIVIILVTASIEKMFNSLETIYDVLTGLEKIGQVTDIPLESDHGMPFETVDTGKGMAIQIKALTHVYATGQKQALRNIDLQVLPGEKICLCGTGGSGRSTLLRLVSGTYAPHRGTVSYNGIPQRNLNIESLLSFIGDISAREDVFRGTLFENISLGHPQATFENVVAAVRAVGLEDFVQSHPLGYDMPINSAGMEQSRTVVQKIMLARVLCHCPRLVTLDEDFANFPLSERERILDALLGGDKPWTLFVVSNDPVFASRCDRVLLMEEGEVVAQGSFSEVVQMPLAKHLFQQKDNRTP
jgi:ABC-type bacteriocin/lantibiotic exporter with double-glycine peptidase domain